MILYTIGYENYSTGAVLVEQLDSLGIHYLADIRDWPFSRRLGFNAGELAALCIHYGLEYMAYRSLGVPKRLRIQGRNNGLQSIAQDYRNRLQAHSKSFEHLMKLVRFERPVCLLCYEYRHFMCHRSLLAGLLAEHIPGLTIKNIGSFNPGEQNDME